eukprot:4768506-Amphidinium_carterae.1
MGSLLEDNLSQVKYMLEDLADPNYRSDSDGTTALNLAVRTQRVAYVQVVIEAAANIEATDAAGWTALQKAASAGSLEVVKLLCCARADVNHCTVLQPSSPALMAARAGLAANIQHLCHLRADVNQAELLREAVAGGHVATTQLLCQDGRDCPALQLAALHCK